MPSPAGTSVSVEPAESVTVALCSSKTRAPKGKRRRVSSRSGWAPDRHHRLRSRPKKSCVISKGCESMVVAAQRMEITQPWTEITRAMHCREGVRYASDMTDAGWWLILAIDAAAEPDRAAAADGPAGGGQQILAMAATGGQRRQLPKGGPPCSTVQEYFYRWPHDRTWARINHSRVMAAREQTGREASPTAGAIDIQSVRTSESGGPRGFDAGKKIKGRPRPMITDSEGHLVGLEVHRADIQDLRRRSRRHRADPPALPMVAAPVRRRRLEPATNSAMLCPNLAAGRSRSSSAPMPRSASRSWCAGGWLNAPSRGLAAAAGAPRTSRRRSPAPSPGPASRTPVSSPAVLQGIEMKPVFSSQALRLRSAAPCLRPWRPTAAAPRACSQSSLQPQSAPRRRDGYSAGGARTIRAVRSRSSDENFDRVCLGLSIAPPSQELEPPANPGRFRDQPNWCVARRLGGALIYADVCAVLLPQCDLRTRTARFGRPQRSRNTLIYFGEFGCGGRI